MKKAIVVLGLMAASGWGAWRWWGSSSSTEAKPDASLTLDRIWIDHIPRNDRDMVQMFAAITEQPFGGFNATSQWKGSFELFRHETHGDQLRVVFPQTGERQTIRAKATRCNVNGMDFCLELSGTSRGVKKYFSRKGWEIEGVRSADDLRGRIEALRRNEGELH
jgi:hypothetical protein